MNLDVLTPGVYRREIAPAQSPGLASGVPVFVGFADAASPVVRLDAPRDIGARLGLAPSSHLGAVLRGFFANGGERCHVMPADPTAADRPAALIAALGRVASDCPDADLVAVPDAMRLVAPDGGADRAAILRVQQAALGRDVLGGGRFALLDPLPHTPAAAMPAHRAELALGVGEPIDAALYYPWIANADGLSVPPCGHVAGIYARIDADWGVWRAPAGGALADVLDVAVPIDDAAQGELNAAGINCLRAFPGRGVRVWGARTLSADPACRHVNVRRLFLALGRWIEVNMGWVAFEPNAPVTWARIERALGAHLVSLWQAGALRGRSPAEAFRLKCDTATNPPAGRLAGELVVELGLAPSRPAEFVVVRLALQAAPS